MTTETETETLQWEMVGRQREDHSMDGSMTLADQNLQGVCEPKPSLLGPKAITRIGCWNVRTMYEQLGEGRPRKNLVPAPDLEWDPEGGTGPLPLGRDCRGLMRPMA